MSPFEALYGRKCRTPLMWSEVGERSLVGPALIKEAEERVAEIRKKLKAAQSRRQSRRLHLSQGFTYSRDPEVSSTRKVSPSVHWTVPSAKESRKSSLPTPTARRNVRYTPGVPCLSIKKVFEDTRDRTRASRSDRFAARPALPGNTSQDSGHCH